MAGVKETRAAVSRIRGMDSYYRDHFSKKAIIRP